MIGCENRDEWLLDLLDGELAPALAAEVEVHLATCEDCRRAVEDYRAIIDSYRSVPAEEPPEEETSRIISFAAVSTARRRRAIRFALATAATLLLAGGAVGGWLLRGIRHEEVPPMEVTMPPVADETPGEKELLRALEVLQRELEQARSEQARPEQLASEALAAGSVDAGIEALKAAKARPGEDGSITGGASKVDGPRGGSSGLAAPRWQAKKKLADDPLAGDLDL